MKKAIAVLSLFSCLLPALARADELDDYSDRLLAVAPSKCLVEAGAIAGNHIRRTLPDLLLDGARNARKLEQAWGPGNDNYRQARDVVEMALQDEEVSNGPLVDFGLHKLVRNAVSGWSPAERAEYLAFLKQKGGRLYWDSLVDGALCWAMIVSVTVKLPHLLPAGEEKRRMDTLKTGVDIRMGSMDLEASLLPKVQRARMEKLGPKLAKSFQDAFHTAIQAYLPRAGKAFQPVVPEIIKIIDAYKP